MSQGGNEKAPDQGLTDLTSTIENKIIEGAKKTNSLFSSACIYRVPEKLRKLKESAYTPCLIAIGPLHREDKQLQTPLQAIKKSYTNNLLCRLNESCRSSVLQDCVKEMKDCVDKARKCYAEELDLSDDDMLEMMLVDGCFILELLYRFNESKYIPKEEGQEGKRNRASTSSDLSTTLLQASKGATRMQTALGGEGEIKTSCGKKTFDPIWDCNWTANTIQFDLVLLENQIPFFVLEKLFRLTVDRIQNSRHYEFSLDDYVFQYFDSMMSQEGNSTSSGIATATSCVLLSDSTVRISPNQMKSSEEQTYHILHKLHEDRLPQTKLDEPQDQTNEKEGWKEEDRIMPCASELRYAGVKFEPVRGKDLLTFEFSTDRKGPFRWCQMARFKIPILKIDDNTELVLRNLIAFEQCCPGVSMHFTSYALLMVTLVNSENDVYVLEEARVMHNYLGASADATNLFNNLCKEVDVREGEFFFDDLCKNATKYTERFWPKTQIAYFASAYAYMGFFIAYIALVIQIVTFVQSFI